MRAKRARFGVRGRLLAGGPEGRRAEPFPGDACPSFVSWLCRCVTVGAMKILTNAGVLVITPKNIACTGRRGNKPFSQDFGTFFPSDLPSPQFRLGMNETEISTGIFNYGYEPPYDDSTVQAFNDVVSRLYKEVPPGGLTGGKYFNKSIRPRLALKVETP